MGCSLIGAIARRSSSRPAGVYWRDDPNFDLAHHMKRVRLPGRGGKQALERFVGDLASEPLDPDHPLWHGPYRRGVRGRRGGGVPHASRDRRRRRADRRHDVPRRWARAQVASRRARGRGRRLAADPDGAGRRGDQRRNPGLDLDPRHSARSRAPSVARRGLSARRRGRRGRARLSALHEERQRDPLQGQADRAPSASPGASR